MPHLSDLFREGEEVTILDSNENEYKIWVMRPSSLQQEESRKVANGKMSRAKLEALDENSDRHASLKLAFLELDSKDDLVETRLKYDENEAREVAFNEVLYEENSEWDKDDKYFGILKGIAARTLDITKYNEQMFEAGSDERIAEADDEELKDLSVEQARFRGEVDARAENLIAYDREVHEGKSKKELRKELISLSLDLESKMMWYEVFKNRMLYYACRYSDDHKKFYFKSVDEVDEIPDYVKTQLYDAYERVEQGSDDLKNLLSPPNS